MSLPMLCQELGEAAFIAIAVIGGKSHPISSQVLGETDSLFINGFVFDEIPAPVVVAAAEQAKRAGAAVFFDPGGSLS